MKTINFDISRPIWNMKFRNGLHNDSNETFLFFPHFNPILSMFLNEIFKWALKSSHISSKKWALKFEFRKSEITLLVTYLLMIYWKFWTFILKIKFRRDCPVFYYLGVFSAFPGLRPILSELLKVNQIDFRKSKKKKKNFKVNRPRVLYFKF